MVNSSKTYLLRSLFDLVFLLSVEAMLVYVILQVAATGTISARTRNWKMYHRTLYVFVWNASVLLCDFETRPAKIN